ncbi:MAG TPA: proline--tRNA ligase [Solirubrobacterales bacterium]|nr:proline--tRNA ligase [Solirubrobacterales bacterium]
MPKSPIADPSEDYPRWYQDVIAKAGLAENGPVRGTMVIRPYGYAIWERIQADIDRRIKAAGADNVYFPLFIPESYLQREAEHVEGFSPELAVVTIAGGKELAEPVVVRPTSETVFGEQMAKWVNSYRDLPLLLNQWANVVRWELRPRLFLRTSEFLWQEGHTVHASEADAAEYALRIHHDVYRDFLVDTLALPVLLGRKTAEERFAGATNTMTCEGITRDRKALQLATSHELGQNFARAFDISYTDEGGVVQTAWTTSWGASTRLVGGLIMGHGDASGLRLPPRIAPTQVAIVVVRDEDGAVEKARELGEEIAAAGVRVEVDADVHTGFGRRAVDWELKGVPLRIDLGPRDLAEGQATLLRRDSGEKIQVPLDAVPPRVADLLDDIQAAMLVEATAFRDAATSDVTTVEEALEAGREGVGRIEWARLGTEGERRLLDEGVSVRCIQRPDGTVPAREDEPDLQAIVARAY